MFEDALWALENPGDVSAPVRSEFGYHLIRLNEIGVADVPTFAERKTTFSIAYARKLLGRLSMQRLKSLNNRHLKNDTS